VENGGQGRVRIDFPNDTTGHCLELEQRLRGLVGAGSVSVVPAANPSTARPPDTPSGPWAPPNPAGSRGTP
jgi:DNA-binding transcriptional regulator LsrR (DeoR family)